MRCNRRWWASPKPSWAVAVAVWRVTRFDHRVELRPTIQSQTFPVCLCVVSLSIPPVPPLFAFGVPRLPASPGAFRPKAPNMTQAPAPPAAPPHRHISLTRVPSSCWLYEQQKLAGRCETALQNRGGSERRYASEGGGCLTSNTAPSCGLTILPQP